MLSNSVPFGTVAFWSGLVRESANVKRIPPDLKSLIVILFPYYCEEAKDGNCAMFAAQYDYHNVIKEQLDPDIKQLKALFPDDYFELFVDDSPFNEVAAAQEAGLGIKGENNLLINEKYGSYVYIATIATSAQPDMLGAVRNVRGYCSGCKLCVRACPGGALGDVFDRTLCASYISQKKGELSEQQAKILHKAGSVYGCDICQKACPANASPARGLACFCDDVNPNYTTQGMARQLKGRSPEWRGEITIRRNLSIIKTTKP